MEIKIIYDNYVWKEGTIADWGFSCLVKAHGKKILFDTGGNGNILLKNMGALDMHPRDVDEIFISHDHPDHTGGLKRILERISVPVYVPSRFRDMEKIGAIRVNEAKEIHKNIFSTGTLGKIEQSLIVREGGDVTIIVGCSHPGVENIISVARGYGRIKAIIGGFHAFDEFELLNDIDLICPTHCTQHIEKLKFLFPKKFVAGGTGKVIFT